MDTTEVGSGPGRPPPLAGPPWTRRQHALSLYRVWVASTPIRARLTLHGPALVSSGLAGSQRPRLQVAPPPWARSRPS